MTTPQAALTPVALAIIWHGDAVLLQLRDFDPDITDPAQWGFLGGHLHLGESPEHGMRRELLEEIGWTPSSLTPLGCFVAAESCRVIHGFSATCVEDPRSFVLREGEELGLFPTSPLRTGEALSSKWKRTFPLTRITLRAVELWVFKGIA